MSITALIRCVGTATFDSFRGLAALCSRHYDLQWDPDQTPSTPEEIALQGRTPFAESAGSSLNGVSCDVAVLFFAIMLVVAVSLRSSVAARAGPAIGSPVFSDTRSRS